jgi:hypothetical protein
MKNIFNNKKILKIKELLYFLIFYLNLILKNKKSLYKLKILFFILFKQLFYLKNFLSK